MSSLQYAKYSTSELTQIRESHSRVRSTVAEKVACATATKEIADRLHLSDKTIAVHRVHIKDKLGIATAGELSHHAIRWVEMQRSSS